MATGYKLDADSIRVIDGVVRRVLAAEPTTRGRQRRAGGGGAIATGSLVVTLEDIPAAKVLLWKELDGESRNAFGEDYLRSGEPPDDQKVWAITSGNVQPVMFSDSPSSTYNAGTDGENPPQIAGETVRGKETAGPFLTGKVHADGQPGQIQAHNMVPEKIYAGKLCQVKKIKVGKSDLMYIDVEPCD